MSHTKDELIRSMVHLLLRLLHHASEREDKWMMNEIKYVLADVKSLDKLITEHNKKEYSTARELVREILSE